MALRPNSILLELLILPTLLASQRPTPQDTRRHKHGVNGRGSRVPVCYRETQTPPRSIILQSLVRKRSELKILTIATTAIVTI